MPCFYSKSPKYLAVFIMFESRSRIFFQAQPQSIPSYKRKANIIRGNIRRKQIDEYFSSIREEMMSSLVEDYQVLKHINLHETLNELVEFTFQTASQRVQKIEKITNHLFIYSHSNQSDHLFYLFDTRILTKLVTLLDHVQDFRESPRSYIRILYVLANYSLYSDERVGDYVEIAIKLMAQIAKIKDFYESKVSYLFFSYSQTKQIMYLTLQSIANDSKDAEFILRLSLQPNPKDSLVALLLDQCSKINHFTEKNTIRGTFVSDILIKIISIFQKIITLADIGPEELSNLLAVDFEIVDSLLSVLGALKDSQKESDAQYRISLTLQQFLIAHLQQNPNIILSHDFSVLLNLFEYYCQQFIDLNFQIANFDHLLQIEGNVQISLTSLNIRSNQLEKRLKTLLNIFNLFFSINIPQDHSSQYEQILENWLVECLLSWLRSIFKINHGLLDQIQYSALVMLKNVCLEESLCDFVLEEFQILNKIFYYIHSDVSTVRMRKVALEVLNSIICATLYSNGDLKGVVLELLASNKIIQIFISNLCEYADNELNINLLNSLLAYLETESCENDSDNTLWTRFCTQGGREKLEKALQTIENAQTLQLIQLILDKYRQK